MPGRAVTEPQRGPSSVHSGPAETGGLCASQEARLTLHCADGDAPGGVTGRDKMRSVSYNALCGAGRTGATEACKEATPTAGRGPNQ